MKLVVIGNGMGEPGNSECPVDIRPGERGHNHKGVSE